jgi:nicotinamidase-related amidase
MKLPGDKTAIVLIESQNDFLSPGGSMYQSMSEQLKKRNVIANLQKLPDGARGKAKIFYVPFQAFRPGLPELKPGGPGTEGLRGIEMKMKADWGVGTWVEGTPGPEIPDAIKP